MPSALVSTEIVVGTLIVVAVLVLATTFLRRRYIARGLPLTLCGMRRPASDRWRLGLIRFGDNALEWYTLGGVSVRPRHRWLRQRLLLDAPEPLAAATRSRSCPTRTGCRAATATATSSWPCRALPTPRCGRGRRPRPPATTSTSPDRRPAVA